MLGIDRPRAKRQQVEPATVQRFSTPAKRFDSKAKGGRERLGGAHAPPARLQPPEPRRQRAAAAVSGMTGLSRAQITRLISSTGRAENSHPPATGGIALPASTRPPTSNCWRRWTRPTKPSAARPRARSSSGNTSSTSSANTAAGGDLGGPDLSPAAAQRLPPAAAAFHQDPAHGGVDRRAAPARPARPARLSASGYGARGSARRQGRLPHQCVDEGQWQVVGATAAISEAWRY